MDESQSSSHWDASSERVLIQNFPVHRACRDGDVEQLGSLLSTGEVDLYEEDDFYGWTPLHWAAYFGKLSCLMKLVEHGAICDAPTERLNQTAAHIAAYGGDSRCLQWLLQSGALICRQDYMGETPCHKAARTGSMECISLLVSQGADLSVRNLSGNTVSQVAAAAGYTECANYLERAAQAQALKKASSAMNGSSEMGHLTNGGTKSSQGPPSAHHNFISTNTYHSNPYVSCKGDNQANGIGGQPAHNNNNSSNHNGCLEDDCDMDMEDGEGDPNWPGKCNGAAQGAGDVLLDQGVSRNLVPLAGKKRGREDVEEECFKRARNDGVLSSLLEGESAHNNNILSSYFAVLAISTDPLNLAVG